jgi:hypothetical protein
MRPVDAFLQDLEIMLRTLVAGAVAPSPKPRAVKQAASKKFPRTKSGDRK